MNFESEENPVFGYKKVCKFLEKCFVFKLQKIQFPDLTFCEKFSLKKAQLRFLEWGLGSSSPWLIGAI